MKYCINCGKQIADELDVCPFCSGKTNIKDNSLLDYMFNHIKGDLKSKTEDKLISIIKNYLLSHLYGTVMVISVVAVAVSAAINSGVKADEIVRYRPEDVVIDD